MSSASVQPGPLSFTITVAGNKIDFKACPVVSITIDKSINKIPYATLVVHDGDPAQRDFPVINSKALEIGHEIVIQAGCKGKEQPIFKGIIVKQAIKAQSYANPVLVIGCKDAAYRTTLLPKNVSFGGVGGSVTDSKVLTDIIGQYSDLSIKAEATAVKHEYLAQPETTDWDFMLLRAEANGQVVIVDDGNISVAKPKVDQSAAATFTYGINMYAFEVEMDAQAQWQGAAGKVWEAEKQVSTDIKAEESGESSFGEMSYSKLSNINKQAPTTFYHGGELAEREMETLAKSLLALNRISKIRGKVTVQGLSTIKPGQVVALDKGAKNFQGEAYVTGVRHKIEEGNWTTELSLGLPNQRYMRRYSDITALPAAGMLPPMHGLQIGIVKKIIEDPKTAYRIFVCLPMLHESNEGIWCRIASFYASQEAGAFFMPELEDEVVLGFIDTDPRSPVILGSLYSTKNTPPAEADEKNSIKTITSKGKLTLLFNDQDQEIVLKVPGEGEKDPGNTIRISKKDSTIEIINGEANKVILGKKDVELFSKNDISISAKRSINLNAGDSLALTASKEVNINGQKVSVTADGEATFSGKGGTNITSSGTTVVKGSTVLIN